MNRDEDTERVDVALNSLSEHFDSVQIFVTRHEPAEEDGTIHTAKGVGNWFCRYGQVKEWLIAQDERTRIHTRKNDEKSDE